MNIIARRVTGAVVAAMVVMLISGCGSRSETPHGATSLGPGAFGGTLRLAFRAGEVKAGKRFGFSFPEIKNRSSQRIVLTSVELLHVPDGVRVEKYALLSVNDSSGKILDSRPGDGDLTDYARFPNYPLSEHVVIKAGELSPFYPVVYLTITGRVRGHASGCRFTFRQDGVEYRQTLPCGFYFHSL